MPTAPTVLARLSGFLACVAVGSSALAGCGLLGGDGAGDGTGSRTATDGCPADAEVVGTADELRDALAAARPGDTVALADGTYAGTFTATASGAADAPITLCGSASTVLDGGSVDEGYTLHLDGASWWTVSGVTVTGGKKGVMLSGASDNTLRGITVHGTGDEAVHLRQGSSRNTLSGSTVFDTGLREADFGEGVYVGSAESNWCDLTDCEPDRSDGNVIEGNVIRATTAEAVDVKEGTSRGRLTGNTFEGPVGTAVDALVDVKGNDWVVDGNTFEADGVAVQVHAVVDGWGRRATVRANVFDGAADPAVEVVGAARDGGSTVACGQQVRSGELSDVPCG